MAPTLKELVTDLIAPLNTGYRQAIQEHRILASELSSQEPDIKTYISAARNLHELSTNQDLITHSFVNDYLKREQAPDYRIIHGQFQELDTYNRQAQQAIKQQAP